MSGYLVNLARRSAGMVPVAHPRIGPVSGPDARLVRGMAQSAVPPPRAGPASPIHAAGGAGEAQQDGLAPGLAMPEVTRHDRQVEPRDLEEPRSIRLNGVAPGVEPRDDARAASPPARPTVGDSAVPAVIGPAPMNGTPEARRDLNPSRRDPEASAAALDGPSRSQGPRASVVEPALSPGLLGGARTVMEPRGRGREVDVRNRDDRDPHGARGRRVAGGPAYRDSRRRGNSAQRRLRRIRQAPDLRAVGALSR